ncbi:hypothetical protein E2C01_003681 [Portunus trituberculatus]|uniref:Uncharacterized protein n=1 Tax=Portunus trituberculatus TaxID=210409 RepID=A0A5B7CPE6_PORTR|nr:hypothetical protein [Portunus trituberculatus]
MAQGEHPKASPQPSSREAEVGLSGKRRRWDGGQHVLGESEDKREGTAKGRHYGGISRKRSFTAIFNLTKGGSVPGGCGGGKGVTSPTEATEEAVSSAGLKNGLEWGRVVEVVVMVMVAVITLLLPNIASGDEREERKGWIAVWKQRSGTLPGFVCHSLAGTPRDSEGKAREREGEVEERREQKKGGAAG